MRDKLTKFLEKHPRFRTTIGVLFVLIGTISILTPFTPVGFLLIVGLELLGLRFLFWDRLKDWFK